MDNIESLNHYHGSDKYLPSQIGSCIPSHHLPSHYAPSDKFTNRDYPQIPNEAFNAATQHDYPKLWLPKSNPQPRSHNYNEHPPRNISPRYTYQENMPRVVIPSQPQQSVIQQTPTKYETAPFNNVGHGNNLYFHPSLQQCTSHNPSLSQRDIHQNTPMFHPHSNVLNSTPVMFPKDNVALQKTPTNVRYITKERQLPPGYMKPICEQNYFAPPPYGQEFYQNPQKMYEKQKEYVLKYSDMSRQPTYEDITSRSYPRSSAQPYLPSNSKPTMPYGIPNRSNFPLMQTHSHFIQQIQNQKAAAAQNSYENNRLPYPIYHGASADLNYPKMYPIVPELGNNQQKNSVIVKTNGHPSVIVSRSSVDNTLSYTNRLQQHCRDSIYARNIQNQHVYANQLNNGTRCMEIKAPVMHYDDNYNNVSKYSAKSALTQQQELYMNRQYPNQISYPTTIYSPNVISPTDSNASDSSGLGSSRQCLVEDGGYGSRCSTSSSVGSVFNHDIQEFKSPAKHPRKCNIENQPQQPRKEKYSPDFENYINTSIVKRTHLQQQSVGLNDKLDVRKFLSTWDETDDENVLTMNQDVDARVSGLTPGINNNTSTNADEQLYVLEYVNISSEDVDKYKHITQITELPKNIQGFNTVQTETATRTPVQNSNGKPMVTVKKNSKPDLQERPPSPVDIETILSQSVISKEASSCNFDIKPCTDNEREAVVNHFNSVHEKYAENGPSDYDSKSTSDIGVQTYVFDIDKCNRSLMPSQNPLNAKMELLMDRQNETNITNQCRFADVDYAKRLDNASDCMYRSLPPNRAPVMECSGPNNNMIPSSSSMTNKSDMYPQILYNYDQTDIAGNNFFGLSSNNLGRNPPDCKYSNSSPINKSVSHFYGNENIGNVSGMTCDNLKMAVDGIPYRLPDKENVLNSGNPSNKSYDQTINKNILNSSNLLNKCRDNDNRNVIYKSQEDVTNTANPIGKSCEVGITMIENISNSFNKPDSSDDNSIDYKSNSTKSSSVLSNHNNGNIIYESIRGNVLDVRQSLHKSCSDNNRNIIYEPTCLNIPKTCDNNIVSATGSIISESMQIVELQQSEKSKCEIISNIEITNPHTKESLLKNCDIAGRLMPDPGLQDLSGTCRTLPEIKKNYDSVQESVSRKDLTNQNMSMNQVHNANNVLTRNLEPTCIISNYDGDKNDILKNTTQIDNEKQVQVPQSGSCDESKRPNDVNLENLVNQFDCGQNVQEINLPDAEFAHSIMEIDKVDQINCESAKSIKEGTEKAEVNVADDNNLDYDERGIKENLLDQRDEQNYMNQNRFLDIEKSKELQTDRVLAEASAVISENSTDIKKQINLMDSFPEAISGIENCSINIATSLLSDRNFEVDTGKPIMNLDGTTVSYTDDAILLSETSIENETNEDTKNAGLNFKNPNTIYNMGTNLETQENTKIKSLDVLNSPTIDLQQNQEQNKFCDVNENFKSIIKNSKQSDRGDNNEELSTHPDNTCEKIIQSNKGGNQINTQILKSKSKNLSLEIESSVAFDDKVIGNASNSDIIKTSLQINKNIADDIKTEDVLLKNDSNFTDNVPYETTCIDSAKGSSSELEISKDECDYETKTYSRESHERDETKNTIQENSKNIIPKITPVNDSIEKNKEPQVLIFQNKDVQEDFHTIAAESDTNRTDFVEAEIDNKIRINSGKLVQQEVLSDNQVHKNFVMENVCDMSEQKEIVSEELSNEKCATNNSQNKNICQGSESNLESSSCNNYLRLNDEQNSARFLDNESMESMLKSSGKENEYNTIVHENSGEHQGPRCNTIQNKSFNSSYEYNIGTRTYSGKSGMGLISHSGNCANTKQYKINTKGFEEIVLNIPDCNQEHHVDILDTDQTLLENNLHPSITSNIKQNKFATKETIEQSDAISVELTDECFKGERLSILNNKIKHDLKNVDSCKEIISHKAESNENMTFLVDLTMDDFKANNQNREEYAMKIARIRTEITHTSGMEKTDAENTNEKKSLVEYQINKPNKSRSIELNANNEKDAQMCLSKDNRNMKSHCESGETELEQNLTTNAFRGRSILKSCKNDRNEDKRHCEKDCMKKVGLHYKCKESSDQKALTKNKQYKKIFAQQCLKRDHFSSQDVHSYDKKSHNKICCATVAQSDTEIIADESSRDSEREYFGKDKNVTYTNEQNITNEITEENLNEDSSENLKERVDFKGIDAVKKEVLVTEQHEHPSSNEEADKITSECSDKELIGTAKDIDIDMKNNENVNDDDADIDEGVIDYRIKDDENSIKNESKIVDLSCKNLGDEGTDGKKINSLEINLTHGNMVTMLVDPKDFEVCDNLQVGDSVIGVLSQPEEFSEREAVISEGSSTILVLSESDSRDTSSVANNDQAGCFVTADEDQVLILEINGDNLNSDELESISGLGKEHITLLFVDDCNNETSKAPIESFYKESQGESQDLYKFSLNNDPCDEKNDENSSNISVDSSLDCSMSRNTEDSHAKNDCLLYESSTNHEQNIGNLSRSNIFDRNVASLSRTIENNPLINIGDNLENRSHEKPDSGDIQLGPSFEIVSKDNSTIVCRKNLLSKSKCDADLCVLNPETDDTEKLSYHSPDNICQNLPNGAIVCDTSITRTDPGRCFMNNDLAKKNDTESLYLVNEEGLEDYPYLEEIVICQNSPLASVDNQNSLSSDNFSNESSDYDEKFEKFSKVDPVDVISRLQTQRFRKVKIVNRGTKEVTDYKIIENEEQPQGTNGEESLQNLDDNINLDTENNNRSKRYDSKFYEKIMMHLLKKKYTVKRKFKIGEQMTSKTIEDERKRNECEINLKEILEDNSEGLTETQINSNCNKNPDDIMKHPELVLDDSKDFMGNKNSTDSVVPNRSKGLIATVEPKLKSLPKNITKDLVKEPFTDHDKDHTCDIRTYPNFLLELENSTKDFIGRKKFDENSSKELIPKDNRSKRKLENDTKKYMENSKFSGDSKKCPKLLLQLCSPKGVPDKNAYGTEDASKEPIDQFKINPEGKFANCPSDIKKCPKLLLHLGNTKDSIGRKNAEALSKNECFAHGTDMCITSTRRHSESAIKDYSTKSCDIRKRPRFSSEWKPSNRKKSRVTDDSNAIPKQYHNVIEEPKAPIPKMIIKNLKQNLVPEITKATTKIKRNFEEALISIDKQYRNSKKKPKCINKQSDIIPKLVIKRNYHGEHYATEMVCATTLKSEAVSRLGSVEVILQRNRDIERLSRMSPLCSRVKVLEDDSLKLIHPREKSLNCKIYLGNSSDLVQDCSDTFPAVINSELMRMDSYEEFQKCSATQHS